LEPLRHSLAALTAAAALPVALLGLAFRPAWRVGLRERLGATPPCAPDGVWLHAASVGEARAAQPLVAELRKLPGGSRPHFLSATTVAGRETSRAAFPDLPVALAPIDHRWCVDTALARVRPRALVLLETELWPQWIAAAARRRVPVALVSARLSDRSFPRYLRLAGLLRPTLLRIHSVGARSEEDAERFLALGVPASRVTVTGDLKFASALISQRVPDDVGRLLGDTPYLVAGSTHAGEESAALASLEACERTGHPVALVVAPRQLDRGAAVLRELTARGRRVVRRSESAGAAPLAAGEILLLDTLGELAALYRGAIVTFVGGTLAPVGGHNLLEPLGAGCPVLFGPRCENVREAAAWLTASGAGRRVESANQLAEAVALVVRDPSVWRGAARRAQAELASHRDSARRSAELVARVTESAERAGGAEHTKGESEAR
jgi:3-deoxy-D-manno-octulosonic-acid transferase